MGLFKKYLNILFVGAFLISCSSCSGLDILNEHLKSGVKDLGNNVAIGKSNALITPYISFDGIRTSDNAAFQASYNASVSGFDGQDILVGNSDLKDKDCRDLTINYTFDSISGDCQLIYIDPDLKETVLADDGEGVVTVQLKNGANYIGIYGINYAGSIQITVE